MTEKNIQDYLDKGLYGAPQIKPEERDHYLGTFRERVYLTMTVAEMEAKENLPFLKQEIQINPSGKFLINANIADNLQTIYMQLAQEKHCEFTIVNNFSVHEKDSLGLVYGADHAVNVKDIDIKQKYSNQENSSSTNKKKKKNFLGRFFS